MLRTDLGTFIKSKREAALISQEDLATKADVSIRTIWALEAGGTTPHFKTLRKLATALSIPTADLLEPEDGDAA